MCHVWVWRLVSRIAFLRGGSRKCVVLFALVGFVSSVWSEPLAMEIPRWERVEWGYG